ncbi:mitochondrial 50S ribosomal protein L3 [Sistotremastrum niveocremeum HHB9708]|uniref:Large ribosomal subunit protein uL3m n=1 Tax=Sistotremastrum niveocremeum HHB9708 TaxID=1314777 RepID=A0A164P7D9_9AGAM|nr:mitochondrial 50S ribosomal protein L3 [Sistotremastrum niveocremeum HHB9708]
MLKASTSRLAGPIWQIRYIHASLPYAAEVSSNASASSSSSSPSTSTTPAKWTPNSVRTGVIARKRGMTAMWDDFGAKFPVTILQLEECQVTANVETVRKDQSVYHAVQVASTNVAERKQSYAMLGHFKRAGVPAKRMVKEFPVTADAHVPVGTTLSAIHFVPGQDVDVIAKGIGKGFQGVMKRWNFSGQTKSHGNSLNHRGAGSTGQNQDPGRVWPGKKMAGRLGGKQITVQNLQVVRIDTKLDLIFVKGNVPGIDDAFVQVRDAKKTMAIGRHNWEKGQDEKVLPKNVVDIPFPAGTKELAAQYPPVISAKTRRINSPFAAGE